jgi:hypothetical protein
LSDAHALAGWLSQLLADLDDEPLLILHHALGRGYRVTISGVADNFQLHTLLADAFLGDPADGWLARQRPAAEVVAAARGATDVDQDVVAQGVFNLVGWRGIDSTGNLPQDMGNSANWIWSEGVPADIEPFDGLRYASGPTGTAHAHPDADPPSQPATRVDGDAFAHHHLDSGHGRTERDT